MKRIISITSAILFVIALLAGCSAEQKIVGRWKMESSSENHIHYDITFFSNGTYGTSGRGNGGGTYSIADNQLMLSHQNGGTTMVDYKIVNRKLIMKIKTNSGDIRVTEIFNKVKK